ncbi:MAG: SDR family oxidoreductase [Candidatus Omnitrophota bacterium]
MDAACEKGTALITGGAKRIGRALALLLAGKGYRVVLHCHQSLPEAELLAETIRRMKVECHVFTADLNSDKDVNELIPQVFSRFSDFCVLVNNASIFERARLLETDHDLFDRHFNINFKAPFFLSQEFARRCDQGHIINMLDTKIARTVVEYFAYTLTKKALFEFTRMAAKELAPRIRVNAVCPGLILPPRGEDEEYLIRCGERIPLRRKGSVENVTAAVSYLLDNDFVTGECLFADGGEHLK